MNPHWNESFEVPFKSLKETVSIECYKYVSKDYHALLGYAEYSIKRLTRDEMDQNKDWFYVSMNEKVSGHIFLEVQLKWNVPEVLLPQINSVLNFTDKSINKGNV